MRNWLSKLTLILSLSLIPANFVQAKLTLENLCQERLVYLADAWGTSKPDAKITIEMEILTETHYQASIKTNIDKLLFHTYYFNTISKGKIVDGKLIPEATIIDAKYPYFLLGTKKINETKTWNETGAEDFLTMFYNLRLSGLKEGHMKKKVYYGGCMVTIGGDITPENGILKISLNYTNCENETTNYTLNVDSEMTPLRIEKENGFWFNFNGWLKGD